MFDVEQARRELGEKAAEQLWLQRDKEYWLTTATTWQEFKQLSSGGAKYFYKCADAVLHAIAPLVEIPDKTAELPALNDAEMSKTIEEATLQYYQPGVDVEFDNLASWQHHAILRAQRDKLAGFHRTYSVEARE